MKQNTLYNIPTNRIDEMANVSADAFISQNDPISRYMFEKEKDRTILERKFFRSLVTSSPQKALYNATSEKLEAVSIWFPPNISHLDDKDAGIDKINENDFTHPNTIKRMQIVDDIISKLTKDLENEPNWYLHLVAVSPKFIKQGLSSLLIRPFLERAKKDGFQCSLITQHLENVNIYKHLGFKVIRDMQIPNSNAKFYSMKTDFAIN